MRHTQSRSIKTDKTPDCWPVGPVVNKLESFPFSSFFLSTLYFHTFSPSVVIAGKYLVAAERNEIIGNRRTGQNGDRLRIKQQQTPG